MAPSPCAALILSRNSGILPAMSTELVPAEDTTNPGRGALIVYILYIAAIFTGLPMLVGVVIAYINRDDPPAWLATHYRYQIRTFWIGMLYSAIAILFSIPLFFISFPVFWLAVALWIIIRCARGIKLLDAKRGIPNPKTWGI